MARKKAKKTVKQVALSPGTDFNVAEAKEPQNAKQEAQFTDPDGTISLHASYICVSIDSICT